MKKLLALILSVVLIMVFAAGCGSDSSGNSVPVESKQRMNYTAGLDGHVTIKGLDDFVVDRASEGYLNVAKSFYESDLSAYAAKITSGKVKQGDISNINYAGKVNGVAFSGGTANNQTLTIGSGQFIDGFEDQLVGVKIGSTVDIKVTFPEGYGDSTDLATGKETIKLSGAKAVFTVTINYVERPHTEINEEFLKIAGFATADEYLADLDVRTAGYLFADKLIVGSTIDSLTPESEGSSYSYYKTYYSSMAQSYGMTLENYLSSAGYDETAFKKEVLKQEMVMYSVLDSYGMTIPKNAITEEAKSAAGLMKTTSEQIISQYGSNYIESVYVFNTVSEELAKKNADKITGNMITEETLKK